MAGRGTGVPVYLKCSTCKKHRGIGETAPPGQLWRTGKTRPRPTNNLVQRMTRTAHELWCSVCGEYMWSAHMDAERKPLIIKEKDASLDSESPKQYSKCLRCGAGPEWLK